MKGTTNRGETKRDAAGEPHRPVGHRAWRTALVGLLLPIAVGSAAQTQPQAAAPVAVAPAAAVKPVHVAPATGVQLTSVLVPNPTPVASGFDVRVYEDMAQQLGFEVELEIVVRTGAVSAAGASAGISPAGSA